MCGILAIFHDQRGGHRFDKLSRRGPDMSGHFTEDQVWMGHTRLAIVGPEAGSQPIITTKWVLVINGEIYNSPKDKTDCHCVPALLDTHGKNAPLEMDGVFSFVAYNKETHEIIVARDAIGVTPLYWAASPRGLYFSSLLDALPSDAIVKIVPPGHSTRFELDGGMPMFTPWTTFYNPWLDLALLPPPTNLVKLMYNAVEKRLMGDVPWGVLLSGGLDSTIVASLAVRLAHLRADYPVVHTFCIGIQGSPDLHWAKIVAEELGTHHVSFEYTVEEGIAAIPEVVRAVETYDVTTIRASTPMWLMGQHLKRRGIKMVLSGEGSDELFAGYLYNHFCPSTRDMVKECQKKMNQLHAFDCARANKSLGDWGVETRIPFLDGGVVDFAMNKLHPQYKLSGTHPDGPRPEKWYLRECFRHLVPKCVVDRTKAQFSDAVGSNWIEQLKNTAALKCGTATRSVTNEATWYKGIFDAQFRHIGADKTVLYTEDSIACSSTAAVQWHAGFKDHLDPSGDAVAAAVQQIM